MRKNCELEQTWNKWVGFVVEMEMWMEEISYNDVVWNELLGLVRKWWHFEKLHQHKLSFRFKWRHENKKFAK